MSSLKRRDFLRQSAWALAACSAGCTRGPDPERVSEEARALHSEALVLDLHIDTLLWTRLFGYDMARRHRVRLPANAFGRHLDLPRAEEGGLDGAVMGLVINPDEVRDELMLPLELLARWERGSGIEQTLATLDLLAAAAAENPGQLRFALTGSELAAAVGEGAFGALAGLEGSHGIGGDLANLALAHARGLRMLGIVHFQATEAAYPMTVSAFDGQGLREFGFELLTECDRLGVVVDLAHLNAAGVADVLGVMRRPFVVSHTACHALCDNPRNLRDAELRRIADAGGVVGIAFGRSFLGRAGVDGLLDHVEHALRVAGEEAVALGSDYDGFIVPAKGMGDVRAYPLITQGMLERGWSRETIEKLLGRNVLRVLVEVTG
ncbi:MAG: dipeptidase [Deltaproteobacteria bacterium]|nr:dipeptidase [Deltaproteobacteria bacterium]